MVISISEDSYKVGVKVERESYKVGVKAQREGQINCGFNSLH